MTWIIDTGMYLDASKKCQQLASDINLALGPLHRTLVSDCAGMAGDHEKSLAWTTGYDQHARDIVTLTAALCNALQRFGDFLAAAGYNWWHSDSTRATGAAPPRPSTSEPFYDSGMQLPPSAKGDNGTGIDTSITGLMEQVGRIPNGDVTKLGIAKDAWKTFAGNSSITGAAERINGVTAKFSGSSDPLVVDIEEKLTTLRNAAQLVADAAAGLAVPVADHHEALGTMRDDINSAVASATGEIAAAVAITVAVVAIVAVFSAGTAAAPAAAGGAVVTVEIVAATASIIRNTVSISRLLVLFGAVTAVGSAAGVFTAIPDLTQNGINAALASIAAMTVKIVEGDNEGGAASTPTAKTVEEKAAAVEEIVTDDAGNPIGWEDADGVRIVSAAEVERAHQELIARLGPPDSVKHTDKGDVEVWNVSEDPKSTINYRSFSRSGGPTIDYNNVPGVEVKRWHIGK
ncbi:hypothetical protein [Nocardia asteroides]|uniref:hypothetical protein n=1 Tax=Nocardia asteroides TaxID=1824 RepID=UPI001E4B67B3|nr:hypothetical protein [Nocardia asteroides]UGT60878.1 hypothetical protein LTT61_27625 [Nocardia asteroides]